MDTGHRFAGLPSTVQPIFWLDDDMILYTGWEYASENGEQRGKKAIRRGIYVLDVRTNKARRHADAEGVLCYRSGYVRYTVKYDSKSRISIRREGTFGQEKEIVADMKQQPGQGLNPLTCRYFDATGSATLRGKRIPLLDGHGVLEFSRVTDSKPGSPVHSARLFPASGKESIVLAINGAHVSESHIRYYEFADLYMIGYRAPPGLVSDWPMDAAHLVYLLRPSGVISEMTLPGGPWSKRRLSTIVLTRAGLVFHGGEIRRWLDPGTAGLYASNGTNVTKLISGQLSGIGVSPDGCRVAVGMNSFTKTGDPTSLRVVDVCGKEIRK